MATMEDNFGNGGTESNFEEQQYENDINRFLSSKNVAEEMDQKQLDELGPEIKDGFEIDEMSRRDWLLKVKEWMSLATQVQDKKTFPWPNAANIKYPLLATAAMQFAARAYPALVPGPELVRGVVKSVDADNQQGERAKRVGRHLSYQIMNEMTEWEENMDRACLILPIVGCIFKKTYYDIVKGRNVSELVTADNLVINYWSKTLEDAPRKTHLIQLTENQVEERKRLGIFLDVDLGEPEPYDPSKDRKEEQRNVKQPSKKDATTPYTFLECHTWYDFDNDGYKEPWIITVEYKTAKVVRIVPRFSVAGVQVDQDKKRIIRIEPDEYFTEFSFIPSPDGGIYGVGFGLLLGTINDTVNTLTNQLIDAGTLANLQSGFLGRNLRIRGGAVKFNPGEWRQVDFTGDDMRKHILPLDFKPPSDVLFKLLEALVVSGKELASVAQIMVGEMPGQNTPATTTMATIEQAQKVFTAIHKRLYRSLTKEYEKLFALNKRYFDKEQLTYFTLNSSGAPEETQIMANDYSDSITVKPNADPNVVSDAQDLARAQGLMQLVGLGTVNPQVVTQRVLKAMKVENIPEVMQMPPPQPTPDEQKLQLEAQIKKMDADLKMQVEQSKMELKALEMKMEQEREQARLSAEQRMNEQEMIHKEQMHRLDLIIAQREAQIQALMDQHKAIMDNYKQGTELAMQQHKASIEKQMMKDKQEHQQALHKLKESQQAKKITTDKGKTYQVENA